MWDDSKQTSPAFLLQADTIIVTEFTDRGKPGDVVVFEEGMSRDEAAEKLNIRESDRFGDTKWFIYRHTFSVDRLLSEEDSGHAR